jgi:5-methylcytosine-specific restriction endonuclease McrA
MLMRKSQKGRVITWGDKISKAKKGHPVYKSQNWIEKHKRASELMKGKKLSLETREKMSKSRMGHFVSEETRKKIGETHKGKHFPNISKAKKGVPNPKLSLAVKGKPKFYNRGEKNNMWKGGITPENEKLRKSLEYKLWRDSVFKRDNYTCVWCGKTGIKLNADHIQLWKEYPELRFAIDNGRTLCVECHKKRHLKVAQALGVSVDTDVSTFLT